MPRDNESLIDIERAVRRVLRYAADCDRASLEINDEKVSAILYQITIIGEATKRLSQDFRQQHPEVPWREIAGMRDVIVHEYDQVDLDVVWDVIQNKLPELLTSLQSLLPSEEP
ncbi:DUF86 domain-containing protein [Leptolyngbya sp. FACHB-541]|uniref:HepT-like ribonuclease domain-containing protein n=1 Tax=Leptolyngbya sp. FACHB-541 TaxID=2692810 RepID=UPI0016861BFD|nr:DUF86 domain-containing protein [Leptolyngbya sp. FACHB-541]MBD2000855.1 DUF86 domain-containing protein [Leptolyngbya sp. FACHB-541]